MRAYFAQISIINYDYVKSSVRIKKKSTNKQTHRRSTTRNQTLGILRRQNAPPFPLL